MEQPILMTITAFSTVDGQKQDDEIHLITSGTLKNTPEGYLLCYDESLDEEAPPQQVALLLEDGGVTMRRGGPYETQMVFRKAQRYQGVYRTPYGDMEMAVYATRVHYRVDESGGDVALQYQLDLAGQFAAMHDMTLQFIRKRGEA